MKTRLLFLTLLLITQTICYSQPYKSIFGNNSTSWIIGKHELHSYIRNDSVYTGVDTTFSGQTYKSVVDKNDLTRGYIREDSSLGKAWYYSNYDEKENLIFDLGLAEGDTFLLNSVYGKDSLIVVDSVYYANGNKHVRFDFQLMSYISGRSEKLTFIEGIGSNNGILYQNQGPYFHDGDAWLDYLLCTYKNDTLASYSNYLYDGACEVFFVSAEDKTKDISWLLYPNPINSTAILEFDNLTNANCNLNIFDIKGSLVRTINNITTGRVEIKKENLQSGLYFFQLQNQHKVISAGKIVVE